MTTKQIKVDLIFLLFLIFLALGIESCSNGKSDLGKIPAKECIAFNDTGVKYMMNYPMDGQNGLSKAIDLFKQAIQCDTSYTMAYLNLANAFDQSKNYEEALKGFAKVLVLTNNDPVIITHRAMVFERMLKIDSANANYATAKGIFEKRLVKHPGDANSIQGKILVIALTTGKDEAIKELDNQIKLHPELSKTLDFEYEFYKYFDKKAFINHETVEQHPTN